MPAQSPHSVFSIGPFDLDERLGRGGMGEVWRAVHRASNTPAAVKVVTAEYARKEAFRESFHREARAMARLDHPSIVRVFDYGRVDAAAHDASGGVVVEGSPYMAIELARDGSLVDVMERGYVWSDVRLILLSVLDALAHSHARGLLHRDIKPGNVLAARHGSERHWKLTDFGIAHALHAIDADRPGELVGTPAYMAPEQFSGTWRDFGPATDLYALGCMAYQLVCGRLPFGSGSPLKLAFQHLNDEPAPLTLRMDVPDGLEAWIGRLLQKNPAARFEKAADAAQAFAQLSGGSSGTLTSIATQAVSTIAPLAPTLPIPTTPPPATPPPATPPPATPPPATPPPATEPGLPRTSTLPLQRVLSDSERTLWRARIEQHEDHAPAEGAYRPDRVPVSWRPGSTTQPHSLVGVSPRLYGLRAIPMVGRETQRDLLWANLRQVAGQRRPRLVVVEGPSGCGKSCLARWLCERADEVGAANYMRATHGPEPSPNDGLAAMLIRWANLTGLSHEEIHARLASLVGQVDDEVYQWLVEDLTALVIGTELDSTRLANQIQATFELLRRLARRRPLIVWIDDLQWAAAAMRLLEHLSAHAETEMPVLFCATVQSEALAERQAVVERLASQLDMSHTVHLEIDALDADENRALLDELLRLDEALARRVARRVAGNLLFAVQLVGDWVERGWLVADQHGFRLRKGVTAELPDNLHSVWVERIERVLARRPASDATALRLAALLGHEVDAREWRKACERADITARTALFERLVELKLAERFDSGWRFVHGMLRESLLRQARACADWRRLNRLAAGALVALADESPRPDLSARIGRLRFRAGQVEQAVPFLLAGARYLETRDDYVAATELLDLLDTACDDLGHSVLRERLEGQLIRARLLGATRQLPRATALADEVYDLAMPHHWLRIAADSLEVRCKIELAGGHMRSAAVFASRSLAIYRQIGERDGELRALLRLGDHGSYVGDHDTAIEHYREALELAEALDLVGRQAWCRWGIGYCLHQLMRPQEARGHLLAAHKLFEIAGQPRRAMSVIAGLSDLDRLTGNFERAKERALRVCRFMQIQGTCLMIPRINIALVYLYEGDLDAAAEWLRRAASDAPVQNRGWPTLHAVKLAIETARGEMDGWDEMFAQLVCSLDTSGFVDIEIALTLEIVADGALHLRHPKRAAQALALASELWEQSHASDRARQALQRATELTRK